MTINNCYENLANNIVIQAVEDYKENLKKLVVLEEHIVEIKANIDECEVFFKSDYVQSLCDLNGRTIMIHAVKQAQRELDDEDAYVTVRFKSKEEKRQKEKVKRERKKAKREREKMEREISL